MYKHVINTFFNEYRVNRCTGADTWNIWEYSKCSGYFATYGNYSSREQAEKALQVALVAGFILYND